MNTYELETGAIDALRDTLRYQLKNDEKVHREEVIYEVADSCTPVYNSDLVELLLDNFNAFGQVPDLGAPTIDRLIAYNVCEYLISYLDDNFEEAFDDINEKLNEK